MPSDVAQLLSEMGPSLSSALIVKLTKRGLSQAAARQRISRALDVKRLDGLTFPNRAQFLFLRQHSRKREFYDNLVRALKDNRTSGGRALIALGARGGAIPLAHFPAASGLPVENARGQLSASTVLKQLTDVELISITPTPDGDVVGLRGVSSISHRRRAVLIAEDVILGAIRPWLINLGWTSSQAVSVRAARFDPKFGQFRFDLVGPSYLNSIVEFRNGRPLNGFIVADTLLDRQIKVQDLDPFFAKLSVLQNQKRSTRFQSMFIADRFEPDALNLLRARGCIVGRPENIFGVEIANQLKELITTLERAADLLKSDPSEVFKLMARIAKLEGTSSNLRGVVLELMIAHLFTLDGYSIDIREQVRSMGGDVAEIDVKATKRNEIICVECKGKSPGRLVSRNEIEIWLGKTIPRIKNWFKSRHDIPPKRRFEFYVSTDYDDDANALIRQLSSSEDQAVKFYRGSDVVDKLRQNRETSLIDIFKEQFGWTV
jgi:hypothetical protein